MINIESTLEGNNIVILYTPDKTLLERFVV